MAACATVSLADANFKNSRVIRKLRAAPCGSAAISIQYAAFEDGLGGIFKIWCGVEQSGSSSGS